MIATIRASLRALCSGAFLLGWTLVFGVARPCFRGRRAERWRRAYLRGACRGLLRICNVSVECAGPRPHGSGFLVTNHMGYLDVLVLASLVDATFVSRADIRSWPLLGPLTRWSGTVYLERDRPAEIPVVVAQMQAWLDRGTLVVFFPEGTSGPGHEVMPFRSSLFESVMRTGAPLHCAALRYTTHPPDPPASKVVSWWGDMDFSPHLWQLLQLRSVRARARFAAAPIAGRDRKELAVRARSAVLEQFEPMNVEAES